METQNESVQTSVTYPVLSDRVQSSFIDGILIILAMFTFASLLNDDAPGWIRGALFFGIWGIYEPLCTTLGGTVGNHIKGIRVRRASTHTKINFFMAFIRYVLKMTLGWISFLTMHMNKERRAIHDFAAGSVMIKR